MFAIILNTYSSGVCIYPEWKKMNFLKIMRDDKFKYALLSMKWGPSDFVNDSPALHHFRIGAIFFAEGGSLWFFLPSPTDERVLRNVSDLSYRSAVNLKYIKPSILKVNIERTVRGLKAAWNAAKNRGNLYVFYLSVRKPQFLKAFSLIFLQKEMPPRSMYLYGSVVNNELTWQHCFSSNFEENVSCLVSPVYYRDSAVLSEPLLNGSMS